MSNDRRDLPSKLQPTALPGGLTLRLAVDAADVERIARFNGQIHSAGEVVMTRRIFLEHPHACPQDLIYIENDAHEVVSSLSLIPWRFMIDGVMITSAEMGIVGTRADYRGQGLIRLQTGWFRERMHERGCVLSHIQGIAYFYRQFGYEYAMPLEGGHEIAIAQIPSEPTDASPWRLARTTDIAALSRLYEVAADDLDVRTWRSEAIWSYLLNSSDPSDGMGHQTWVREDVDGTVIGYLRSPFHHFGEYPVINETSSVDYAGAVSALQLLRGIAVAQNQPAIRLNLPAHADLVRVARSLGAVDRGTYNWQVMVPDVAAFLRALAASIESRIARSPLSGLTREVRIGLYRETLNLRFERGRLVNIEPITADVPTDVRLPPFLLGPLTLGHRTFEELCMQYPDCWGSNYGKLLLEIIFPRRRAFLYTQY